MLDSFRPILRTWNQLPEGSPFLNDVEATLQLLGSAFAGISKFRRSNAMRHVAPELLPLLKDDRMFSSHEYERLFGDKFLTAMVKDADDFEKVKKFAGRSGVPIPKRSENRTSSGQSSYGYRSGDNHYQPFSSGSRSSGRSYPTFTSKQKQTSGYVSHFSVSSTATPIKGRLSFFADAWSRLSADPWILTTVIDGYHIEFVDLPLQEKIPTGCIMSQDMEAVCDQEINLLLQKGAIARIASDKTDGFISNLFVIPKKSGGWHPIINSRHLNSFVQYRHFKMEGLDYVEYLLQRGNWMIKLDLQDAYFLVPLSQPDWKYVRLHWKNSSAPRVFTKLWRTVVAFLRERGIRLVIYLDDLNSRRS